MEKLKKYFSTKRYGYYLILVAIAFALITIITFFIGLGDGYLSWFSFAALLTLVLGDLLLFVFKKENFIPALNTICSGLALAFFINSCYSYVATVMTGIDIETFALPWTITSISSATLFIISAATVFTPLSKNSTEKVEENK